VEVTGVPRETVQDKAKRYLTEGRVIVDRVADGVVRARVRGAGAVHHVGYDHARWACDCPARGRCAHLLAVGLVVAIDARQS
jgi:uncharacterized Zn finger protein